MGNRYHSQRGPTSVAGISRRRSLRGMLDARDKSTADIRGVQWLHPQGTAGAIVQNISGGQSYYISNPTGKTFKEGTILPAGSFSGAPKDFIITGPPAGPRGAQVGGGVRRQTYRNGAPQEVPVPNIYVLFYSGLNLMLGAYIDNAYEGAVASYTTVAAEPDYQDGTWIQNDSLGLVSNSSYVFWGEKADTSNSVVVCDIQNGVEYTYDAAAGSTIFALMHNPADGYLYWLEYKAGSVPTDYDVTMKKAKTDLTSDSTVGSSPNVATYASFAHPTYSSNAILFVNRYNAGGQHFSYVHRVSTAGAFSISGLSEVSSFHPHGGGIPVPASGNDSAGYWSSDEMATSYGAVDTSTATHSPSVVQKFPAEAVGVPSCFNAAGTQALFFNGPNVQIYTYGDTSSAPLTDVTLDEPTGSGYATTDIFDIVLP